LGLVLPSRRQLAVGLGLGVGMALAMQLLDIGIEWVWASMGWTPTDEEAFGKLTAYTMSPVGALVTGVTAGLGEELAVRGVLQPRLGILLSNLFFTGLHAMQYNWDALLVVFLLGLVMGIIRWKSNTTTSAVTHGSYDFCVIMADVLQIPWLL
jgi:membrane protease YdiL (CAAX protease family)